MKRVCVLGIDCMSPEIVFGSMRDVLPNFAKLLEESEFGILQSSFPPTTIPAWMSMFTGKTPGELGVYGFKHRDGHPMQSPIRAVTRLDFKAKPIWEWVERQGLEAVVVGCPSSWPASSLRGAMLTDFTTPSGQVSVYPDHFASLMGSDWKWDLENWRHLARDNVLDKLKSLSHGYWSMFEAMLRRQPDWALAVLVDIGMDRAQHLFWEPSFDEGQAPRRGSPLWDYYRYTDARVGEFLNRLDPNTALLVVSDHGAQAMRGSFALNQWLLDLGLLVLKEPVVGIVRAEHVDWDASIWWGEGGYVGKLHASPKHRSFIRPAIDELRSLLAKDELQSRITFTIPDDIYPVVRGNPPDAFVTVDHYQVRCIGSIDESAHLWREDNDLGTDAANHHPDGVFIARGFQQTFDARHQLQDIYRWIQQAL